VRKTKRMNKYLDHLINLLNERLKLFMMIGFGLFLFILFFQPFPLDRFDFNNRLLFIAGFGAITFIILSLVFTQLPWISSRIKNGNNLISSAAFSDLITVVLSSLSFVFYLRFVGYVSITFYIVFKVVLICIAPPLFTRLYIRNKELSAKNEVLLSEIEILQNQIDKKDEEDLNKTIEFISENKSENLKLYASEIVYIQSADNYVEIVFTEGEYLRKKLIRNTLKNIELQIKPYSIFQRCHRAYIVNLSFAEKLKHELSNYWIILKGYSDRIPVSRQYLLKLRESL